MGAWRVEVLRLKLSGRPDLPGSDGDPTVGLGAGRRSSWPAPFNTLRALVRSLDMWRAEHTVFAVIAFIAAIMVFMVHWHRAGDVSLAKTEADCQKAGGMWEMNMCMEKKQ